MWRTHKTYHSIPCIDTMYTVINYIIYNATIDGCVQPYLYLMTFEGKNWGPQMPLHLLSHVETRKLPGTLESRILLVPWGGHAPATERSAPPVAPTQRGCKTPASRRWTGGQTLPTPRQKFAPLLSRPWHLTTESQRASCHLLLTTVNAHSCSIGHKLLWTSFFVLGSADFFLFNVKLWSTWHAPLKRCVGFQSNSITRICYSTLICSDISFQMSLTIRYSTSKQKVCKLFFNMASTSSIVPRMHCKTQSSRDRLST